MAQLTASQVYALARNAGLNAAQATIATAIAWGESGLRSDAMGDTTIQTDKWGPSVGLWQIRSLKAEYGRGTARDAAALTDPEHNARAMVEISGGGTNWRPWTIYTNGTWRNYLARSQGAGDEVEADPKWREKIARGFPKGVPAGDAIAGAVDRLNPFSGWQDDARRLGLQLAAVAGGLALVVIGAWRTVSRKDDGA